MPSMTHEQFIEKSKNKFPHIDIIDKYTGCHNKIRFFCNKHNYTFEKEPVLYLNSRCGCNKCARESTVNARKVSKEDFSQRLKVSNGNIEQLSDYLNMYTKIKVRCKKCGNIFMSKPEDLLYGHGCRRCAIIKLSSMKKKDNDWFVGQMRQYNLNYNDIELLSKYNGYSETIKCKCKKCSNIWETKASNLISKRCATGCPRCATSKGELIVFDYLSRNDIKFEVQKRFPDLVGVHNMPLSYDFYIPNKRLLIEVNGLQHYEPIKYFGGKKKFLIQKEHDSRKCDYAKAHGYNLFKIDYSNTKETDNIIMQLQKELVDS